MAITTFALLKTAAANWLLRSDLDSTDDSRIEEFIALAEAGFNRRLRTREQYTRSTASSSSQFVGLPSDLLELVNVQINTSPPKRLIQATPSIADDIRTARSDTTGVPVYFAIAGKSLELVPTPSSSTELELMYYQTIPALTSSATTNWLLTSHPDLYLYGTLVSAEGFLMNDARMPFWKTQVEQGLEEVRVADERAQSFGDMPTMMPATRLDYGQWK